MDGDGTQEGYDVELTRAISDAVNIPVIASGGAGRPEHFTQALTDGGAAAALAASLFHFRELSIMQVKEDLRAAASRAFRWKKNREDSRQRREARRCHEEKSWKIGLVGILGWSGKASGCDRR